MEGFPCKVNVAGNKTNRPAGLEPLGGHGGLVGGVPCVTERPGPGVDGRAGGPGWWRQVSAPCRGVPARGEASL